MPALGDDSDARFVPFDAATLRLLAARVTQTLGIKMPEVKLSMLHGRLQRRYRELNVKTIAEYVALLDDPMTGPQEFIRFCDLATTNKTDFFRESEHFTHLMSSALPKLLAEQAGRSWKCRVWCAGCSTGAEVYTLAMVLSEFGARNPGFDFDIWATDISTRVLRQAESATYSEVDINPVPPAMRKRYLLRSRDPALGLVRVDRALRDKVTFARLNFMDGSYATPHVFDVVFFRNVLIYFDRPTQEAVVKKQCARLRTGGYLYIGHSESLNGLQLPIENMGVSVFRRLP